MNAQSERNAASGVKGAAAAQMGYSDTLLSTMAAELSIVTDGEAVVFTCQRFESVTGQVIYALSLLGGGGERIAHNAGASRCVPPALGELGKGQGSTKGGCERFIPKGSRHVDQVGPQM